MELVNNKKVFTIIGEYIGYRSYCDYCSYGISSHDKYLIEIFKYLFTKYCDTDNVNKELVRYLKVTTNVNNLLEYKNLITVEFDDSYNYKLKPGMFPDSVQHIILPQHYNQQIEDDVLPKSILSVSFMNFL